MRPEERHERPDEFRRIIEEEVKSSGLFLETINPLESLRGMMRNEWGHEFTMEHLVAEIMEQVDAILEVSPNAESLEDIISLATLQYAQSFSPAFSAEVIETVSVETPKIAPEDRFSTVASTYIDFDTTATEGNISLLLFVPVKKKPAGIGRLLVRAEFLKVLPQLEHVEAEWIDLGRDKVQMLAEAGFQAEARELAEAVATWENMQAKTSGFIIHKSGYLGLPG